MIIEITSCEFDYPTLGVRYKKERNCIHTYSPSPYLFMFFYFFLFSIYLFISSHTVNHIHYQFTGYRVGCGFFRAHGGNHRFSFPIRYL